MSETTLYPNPSQIKGMNTKAPLLCILCARLHKDDPEFHQRVSVSGGIIMENGVRRAEVACLHCGHRWQSSHPAALRESHKRYPVVEEREELYGTTRKLMDAMVEACGAALGDDQPTREVVKAALRAAQQRGYYLTRRGR